MIGDQEFSLDLDSAMEQPQLWWIGFFTHGHTPCLGMKIGRRTLDCASQQETN
jgi:hypothetical protein